MEQKIEGFIPPDDLPKISTDFNAFSLSFEDNDNCYYAFHPKDFNKLDLIEGLKVFVWDESDENEIIGYIATFEKCPGLRRGWRARRDENTWYRGPKFW